jgi:hypothetical protein
MERPFFSFYSPFGIKMSFEVEWIFNILIFCHLLFIGKSPVDRWNSKIGANERFGF